MTNPDMMRTGEVRLHDTSIGVWEEKVDEPAMVQVFHALLGHLRARGFVLGPDEPTERFILGYRPRFSLREAEAWRARHGYGRKGDLEFHANTSGRCIELAFFQNVANIEHPNGGRYEFDTFKKMPRTMRLLCAVEIANALRFLRSLGYGLHRDLHEPLLTSVVRIGEGRVEEGLSPLDRFNRQWGADRFTRDAAGWPTDIQSYDSKDADGAILANGDERNLYVKGRLVQGRVYTSGGNMWSIVLADGSPLWRAASFEFFSGDRPRREVISRDKQEAILQRRHDAARRKGDEPRMRSLAAAMKRAGMGESPLFYVLSLKHTRREDGVLTWWGYNDNGYCMSLEAAGKYRLDRIQANPEHYDDGEDTLAIPVEAVDALATTVDKTIASLVSALDQRYIGTRVVLLGELTGLKRKYGAAKKRRVRREARRAAERRTAVGGAGA